MIDKSIEFLMREWEQDGGVANDPTAPENHDSTQATLERLGIDPDEVRESFPQIVHAAIQSRMMGQSAEQAIASAYTTGIMIGAVEAKGLAKDIQD